MCSDLGIIHKCVPVKARVIHTLWYLGMDIGHSNPTVLMCAGCPASFSVPTAMCTLGMYLPAHHPKWPQHRHCRNLAATRSSQALMLSCLQTTSNLPMLPACHTITPKRAPYVPSARHPTMALARTLCVLSTLPHNGHSTSYPPWP